MTFYSEELHHLAEWLGATVQAKKWKLSTAESCTGGGLSHAITSVPGSSLWFVGGVVSYSNQMKIDFLDVPVDQIDRYGEVSEQVAVAMARGAVSRAQAQAAIAITGIAGPDGGTPDKPIGLVWVGSDDPDRGPRALQLNLSGDRDIIRHKSMVEALKFFLKDL